MKFVTVSVCNEGVEERGHEEMCMCMVLCIHRGWRTLLHACIMYNQAEVEGEWLDVLDQWGSLADQYSCYKYLMLCVAFLQIRVTNVSC